MESLARSVMFVPETGKSIVENLKKDSLIDKIFIGGKIRMYLKDSLTCILTLEYI
jgi:hypothetical protein